MNSTLASRKAANAAEKNTDDRFENANERTRRSAGSTTGEGCVRQRAQKTASPARRGGERAERARVGPAPLGPLDEAQREHADGADDQARAQQVGRSCRGSRLSFSRPVP